ncbi:hypothetical protein GGH96_001399 [Coemansia sp. RSA 1972]|nr:hypothetical protein GGH96_001399 [Coemansia sp. RSA 1972]
MRLAEQNTLDIQRISLEKKRQAGMAVDPGKRRKVEIEQRVRQREAEDRVRREAEDQRQEKDERQRLEKRQLDRVEADKRQQRLDTEKRQRLDAERRRLDREKRVDLEKKQGPSAYKRQTKVVCPPSARSESRDKPKQPLSYDELMRIASNKSSPAQPAPSAKASASAKSLASVKTSAPVKTPAPKPSASVRNSALAKRPTARPESIKRSTEKLVKSAVPVNNALAKRLESERHAKPAARRPVQPQPRRRDEPTRPTKAKVPEPEPRVRKAPEREIDRFGVRSMSRQPTARRDPVIPRSNRSTSASSSSRPRPPPPRADKAKRQVAKYEDDASEYDSMDDFIVEDEDDEYRAGSIRAMFGVRYRYVDDDDTDDMEVSAVQLMREDRHSARIGRLEDEEEERKLAAEEARRHVY